MSELPRFVFSPTGIGPMAMVDPANTTLGRMLLDEISPVVMVLRTPLVEESCRKNGLSFTEMLSPFCNFNNIDGTSPNSLGTIFGAFIYRGMLIVLIG